MSILVGGYQGAKKCTGDATVGAEALMSWYLGAYEDDGAADLGIYVCKTIAGGKTTSLHGEGRAADLGSRPYRRLPFMDDVADALVAYSRELGVQCVIHNRQIWSSAYPHAGWRAYGGRNPHTGHIHAELTWWAARNLTVARINSVLDTAVSTPRPRPAPKPKDWTEAMIMALPTLKKGAGMKGAHSEDVQTMQNLLQARGFARTINANGGADGRFGKATDSDLRRFQRARGIADDGINGKVTWHHLLNQQRLL